MKFIDELRLGHGTVWRYYLFNFFSGLTFYIAVLVPFYTQWGHLSLTQVQLLQSWLMIWVFILNAPTGAIADIVGRKKIVAIGCLLNAISTLMYVYYPGFYPFLLAEFVGAVGLSFISGAVSALMFDSLMADKTENKYQHVLGRATAINQSAAIIASISGSFLAARMGIQYPMLYSAIPMIILGIIILTVREVKSKSSRKINDVFKTTQEGLSYLLHHSVLRKIVMNDVFTYSSAYFLMWLYQPALQKLGLAIFYFGFIRAVFSLSGILFNFDLSKVVKIFGSRDNFLAFSSFICSLVLILIAFFNNIPLIILGIIILGGFGLARTMVVNGIMNHLIKSDIRATVLSGIVMVNTLVYALMNPLVGYLADHSVRFAFLLIGIIPIIVQLLIPIKTSHFENST